MATVTQQEVAPLLKHLNITINKEDYLPSFEKTLKDHSKKANIPGFRKGMVPTGLIRKMYGNSLFVDEVLRTVDKEVNKYIETEKLDIFAQPLPVEFNLAQLDPSKPENYSFTFEVGMKPDFQLPDLASIPVQRYRVEITDEMVGEEIERLRSRHGNRTEPEEITDNNHQVNVAFTETDAEGNVVEGGVQKENSLPVTYFKEDFRKNLIGRKAGDTLSVQLEEAFEEKERQWVLNDLGLETASGKHFRLAINKIMQVEPKELNEEFFTQLFPGQEVKTEEAFRQKIREELEQQWAAESRNQIHHNLYHVLLDNTQVEFPVEFLKRWLKTQGAEEGQQKTDEEVEKELPTFLRQLKWTVIADKIIRENDLHVQQDDVRQFAKQQLLGYMGGTLDMEQEWVSDYINRMMKDRKFVDDAFNRLQAQKLFDWAETKIHPTDTPISREAFIHMNEEHQHHHH